MQKIDRSLLGWVGAKEPTSSWSKGAVTTVLCQFIENLANQHDLENSHSDVLQRIAPSLIYSEMFLTFPSVNVHNMRG